jgi:hypothetical protein
VVELSLVVVRAVGFDPRCGPAQSGPRAPGAPAHPMPPPQDPFGSFDFSRAVTSLSLSHLSLSHISLSCGVGVLGPTAHPGLPLKVFLGVGRCRQL